MPPKVRAETVMTSQPRMHRDTRHPLERRELVCPICGYRIVLDREPDRCPMCGGEQWEFAGWRPFGPGDAHPPRPFVR